MRVKDCVGGLRTVEEGEGRWRRVKDRGGGLRTV